MIHDALFILWDCSLQPEMFQKKDAFYQGEEGNQEIFGRICDIAKSHHRIQNFIADSGFHARKTREISHWSTGLYSQALSEGLVEILQAYKQTLIEVEATIIENQTLTLSYVNSNVEKYRGLFNTLNRMISTIKERRLKGCQILSLVHQHILTGNEMVHETVVKVFSNTNRVFINQLCDWLLYGELKDLYQEFFIYKVETDHVSDTIVTSLSHINIVDKTLLSALQETECGYNINPVLIPHYMPLSLAQEILFIGKTVILFGFDPRKNKKRSQLSVTKSQPLRSFIQNCADSRRFTIWEEKESMFNEKLHKLKGVDFEISDLRMVVHDIKECVTKHLWVVAVEEAQLIHELRLMKDFYLLGRGELFLELLRLSAHLLDSPTTRTSTRDINHAFQLAARAVFLSNSVDIEKFSFELPYVKPDVSTSSSVDNDSSTVSDGWSSIVLRYHFRWPLHLVFTPEVLARYNDMFRLLLRIKKTQHDLHALWNTYKHSKSFSMCQLHNKLMFLMDNLQHYLQADVLETNFSKLMEIVGNTCDFEKLKAAHATFLADVLSQSFLTVTATTESEQSTDTLDCINNPVFCNIMELLKLCHSFCSMSEIVTDKESEDYYLRGYTERFNKLVKQLMQLLVSFREHPCGIFLARLLMRLDYNRWLSGEAQLTQSVTNMLNIVG